MAGMGQAAPTAPVRSPAPQVKIPMGKIPLNLKDRAWFKRWLRRYKPNAYQWHQSKDPGWIWVDPEMMALFLDAKQQVIKGLKDSGNWRDSTQIAAAKNYVAAMMSHWWSCNPTGASAWITAPNGKTVLALPLGYVKVYPWTTSKRRQNAIKEASCPDASAQSAMWHRPLANQRIKGTDLLTRYINAKNQRIAAAIPDPRQRVAAQKNQLRLTYEKAQTAVTNAHLLRQSMTETENKLAQSVLQFEQAREQKLRGAAVSNETLAAMQADIARLTGELSAVNAELEGVRRDAELAEEAYGIEQELLILEGVPIEPLPPIEELPPPPIVLDPSFDMEPPMDPALLDSMLDPNYVDPFAPDEMDLSVPEPSFLNRYKWHLLIGGGIAAAGGWYYLKKSKNSAGV
ncbi:MAG: hypothetical protein ACYSWO_25430 [Planctomycetota bacterium]|jgi:hypothetical protein